MDVLRARHAGLRRRRLTYDLHETHDCWAPSRCYLGLLMLRSAMCPGLHYAPPPQRPHVGGITGASSEKEDTWSIHLIIPITALASPDPIGGGPKWRWARRLRIYRASRLAPKLGEIRYRALYLPTLWSLRSSQLSCRRQVPASIKDRVVQGGTFALRRVGGLQLIS